MFLFNSQSKNAKIYLIDELTSLTIQLIFASDLSQNKLEHFPCWLILFKRRSLDHWLLTPFERRSSESIASTSVRIVIIFFCSLTFDISICYAVLYKFVGYLKYIAIEQVLPIFFPPKRVHGLDKCLWWHRWEITQLLKTLAVLSRQTNNASQMNNAS